MRQRLQRYLPNPAQIRALPFLGPMRERLADPRLWHLNRASVTVAVAVGLLAAFIPIPGQTVLVVVAAVILRCNLPVAVGLVFLTNPITMPPLFFACYQLGAWLMDAPLQAARIEPTFEWLTTSLGAIWQPFLLGCLVAGVAASILGATLINVFWRLQIITRWRERKLKRAAGRSQDRREKH